jgi:hypothetical protein
MAGAVHGLQYETWGYPWALDSAGVRLALPGAFTQTATRTPSSRAHAHSLNLLEKVRCEAGSITGNLKLHVLSQGIQKVLHQFLVVGRWPARWFAVLHGSGPQPKVVPFASLGEFEAGQARPSRPRLGCPPNP